MKEKRKRNDLLQALEQQQLRHAGQEDMQKEETSWQTHVAPSHVVTQDTASPGTHTLQPRPAGKQRGTGLHEEKYSVSVSRPCPSELKKKRLSIREGIVHATNPYAVKT